MSSRITRIYLNSGAKDELSWLRRMFAFSSEDEHVILEMRGKPAGIMQQIYRLLGLDTDIYFIVTRDSVQFRFVNFNGQTTVTCPFDALTAMVDGVSGSKWTLYVSFVAIAGGFFLFNGIIQLIPIAIELACLYYFFSYSGLRIGFSTGDFIETHGLIFDAALPNGQQMSMERLLQIIEHINLVLLNTHGSAASRSASEYIQKGTIPPAKSEISREPVTGHGMEEHGNESDITTISTSQLWSDTKKAFKQKDYEKSIQLSTQLIDREPDFRNVYRLRSESYFHLGKRKEALSDKAGWKQLGNNNH